MDFIDGSGFQGKSDLEKVNLMARNRASLRTKV